MVLKIDKYAGKFGLGILLLLSACLAMGSWLLASPLGSSPDDNFHLASIWCGRGHIPRQCEVDSLRSVVLIPAGISSEQICYSFKSAESAACQSLIKGEKPLVPSVWNNLTAKIYPPGYYFFMSFLVGDDAVRSVLTMRTVNLVLALVLWGVLFCLVRGTGIEKAAIFPLFVLSVPLGLFLIVSNNPSSWAVIGTSSYWSFVYLLLKERWPSLGKRMVLWIGALLAALIAIFSRVDSSAYLLVSTALVFFMVVGFGRGTIEKLRGNYNFLLPLVLCALAVGVFLFQGQGPKVLADGLEPLVDGRLSKTQLFLHNLSRIPSLWRGAIGGWPLGWLDTPMPKIVPVSAWLAVVIFFCMGMVRLWRSKFLAVAGGLIALTAIPLIVLTKSGRMVGEVVQPRYLLPLMYVGLGLSLVENAPEKWRRGRSVLALIVMLCLSAVHAIALHRNIRRYVTGLDVSQFDLTDGYEWWWAYGPSPMVVWAVGSLAFSVAATLATLLLLDAGSSGKRLN